MRRIVQYSGGVGSWAAAARVAERYGSEDLVLLFADTRIEDEDLYRFLEEGAAAIGGELVRIADGRTPWEVFEDERFLGNARVDPCSKILKRDLLRRWIEEHATPEETVVYLGIDWTEAHRFERAVPRWKPWILEAPLVAPPYLTKEDHLATLRARGIRPPRLYELGFPHNNCGGGCVKAGQGTFRLLREKMPERFAEWEANEGKLREMLGDVAILRDRRGSSTGRPLPLSEFRERLELLEQEEAAKPFQLGLDLLDFGGCGCAVD